MTVRKRIEVEVFRDDLDTLKTQMSVLKGLFPQNAKVEIIESSIPYSLDTDYSNCSASEILNKEIARLDENKCYRKRTLLAETEIEETEFINILENAGFVVIREIEV